MYLDEAEGMNTTFGGKVGNMSFFSGCEMAYENIAAISRYSRTPTLIVKRNSKQTAGQIVAVGLAYILSILRSGSFAKIVNSVIRPVTIYVVNIMWRPFAIHVEPCEAVSFVDSAINIDADVAVSNASCNSSGFWAIPALRTGTFYTPHKQTGRGGILKTLAQARKSNIGSSHLATPIRGLVRRPGSVSSALGPSLILPLER